jgi:Ca-activated chloride channel family protein
VLLAIGAAFLVWAAGCTGKTEAPPDAAKPLTTGTGATASIDEPGKLYVVDSPAAAGAIGSQPTDPGGLATREALDLQTAQATRSRAETEQAQPMTMPVPAMNTPGFRLPAEPLDRETYEHPDLNPVRLVSEHPVSTFSIDVDTGAYANVRRFLNQGRLPPEDAVRIEEMINYFDYGYPATANSGTPFSVSTEIAPAPWNGDALLLQIGIKGYEVPSGSRPPANLVFLVDVSGSMQSPDKLPLLKNAFRLMTGRLGGNDRVAIVVYAGASGLVLESTPGDRKAQILGAFERMRAGGSTNGGAGIRLAYRVAADNFIDEGINRVILATDGDFNVGTVSHESLVDLVERNREAGIALTTLGFGQGNYDDHLLEQLADHGNGNYAYIDTLNEARKVLVEEIDSTLQVIAKDVKIQIEFNPAVVAEYRLIGYENRMLRREDFNNDRIDAGEIGSGHTVTALYELRLVGSGTGLIDPLRYGAATREELAPSGDELGFLRLRYKAPGADRSALIESPVMRADIRRGADTSEDFRFAAAVAAFGQALKGGHYLGTFDLGDVNELARGARGEDRYGYRGEFVSLVALAAAIEVSGPLAAR